MLLLFFFNVPPTNDIYTLSLHDALPISREISMKDVFRSGDSSKKFKIAEGQWYRKLLRRITRTDRKSGSAGMPRPISYAVFCLKKKSIEIHFIHVNSSHENALPLIMTHY